MVDRTVKVSLVAQVSGYVAGMETAARKTRELGTEAERLAAKRQAFEDLGRPLLAFGAIAAAAVGIAIKKFADFDQAMSNVAAVTNATVDEMNDLRAAALDAGGRTVFTATEAAGALEELGKAGFDAAESIAALDGTLALAAAGQLEVARSAEIVATTIKQYGLEFSEASHVSDVFAAAAGKALGSVEDIAQALKFVGPVAASMGVSLEETAGALALFADQGVLGEQAGTSLRGVLSSLTSPSKEAQAEINRLNISLYDTATGGFAGLENVAGQLDGALTNLTDKERDFSLGLIFGNQQVTAARIIFQGGAAAIAKYTAEVNDAGYAAKVSAERLDNLKGDVEKLSGAFDTLLIQSGSGANDVLRTLTQTLTFLVDAASGLPTPMLAAGLAVGTVAAAIALTGGAALIAVPRVAAFRAALATTAIGAKGAAVAIGTVGGAIGLATLVIGAFIEKQAQLDAVGDALVDSLDKSTGAFTDYSREIVAKQLQETGAAKTAEQFGISLDTLTDAALGNADALALYNEKIGNINTAGAGGAGGIRELQAGFEGLRAEVEGAPDDLAEMQAATEGSADAYQNAAEQVASLQSELNSLIETINKANGIGQDAVSTNAAYQAALESSAQAVADFAAANGLSVSNIDESTAAGAKNAAMFADLAEKSQNAAKAQFELDGNADNYIATLESGRQALYDQILGLTGSADAAQELADKVYAIPSQREIDILVDESEATRRLSNFFTLWNGRVIRMSVQTNGTSRTPGFATGGYTGDGPKYQPAGIVHAGEWVSTQETVAKPGNRAALAYMQSGGEVRGYAGGGYVAAPTSQMPATTTIEWNLSGVDPVTVSELISQKLQTKLVTLR